MKNKYQATEDVLMNLWYKCDLTNFIIFKCAFDNGKKTLTKQVCGSKKIDTRDNESKDIWNKPYWIVPKSCVNEEISGFLCGVPE